MRGSEAVLGLRQVCGHAAYGLLGSRDFVEYGGQTRRHCGYYLLSRRQTRRVYMGNLCRHFNAPIDFSVSLFVDPIRKLVPLFLERVDNIPDERIGYVDAEVDDCIIQFLMPRHTPRFSNAIKERVNYIVLYPCFNGAICFKPRGKQRAKKLYNGDFPVTIVVLKVLFERRKNVFQNVGNELSDERTRTAYSRAKCLKQATNHFACLSCIGEHFFQTLPCLVGKFSPILPLKELGNLVVPTDEQIAKAKPIVDIDILKHIANVGRICATTAAALGVGENIEFIEWSEVLKGFLCRASRACRRISPLRPNIFGTKVGIATSKDSHEPRDCLGEFCDKLNDLNHDRRNRRKQTAESRAQLVLHR